MSKHATPIQLTPDEETTLRRWLRASSTEQRRVDPARIVFLAAQGQHTSVIARALREQKTIIDVVREEKLLTEAQIAQILDPIKLTEPGLPGR